MDTSNSFEALWEKLSEGKKDAIAQLAGERLLDSIHSAMISGGSDTQQ